ncbi:hypothetical protein [Rhodopila globiformis]|uniref:Uncharacterized protein n=1 Tax=Rhodopila globiformis TaxID=1071 RepID=A0A2S6N0H0_RHOGL|nr:hypothetical protein [Rhodopila globiformis]PPQ28123.1 hypothetical protein CCS01_25100 [Rhodopila globiformis]
MLSAFDADLAGKIKDVLKLEHPSIRSQHSDEAIAAGLGFRTYNGLRAALDTAAVACDPVPNIPGTVCRRIDDDAFRRRVQTLAGIDLPPGAFLEAVLRACPAVACGEDAHERMLVAIAHGVSANYIRRILGGRYHPVIGVIEFIRFHHDADCPVSWNNGVAANLVFHNTDNKLFSPISGSSEKHVNQMRIDDKDLLLPLYRRELAAMSRLAREAAHAIAGDLSRLPECGRLLETSWGTRYAVEVAMPCCDVKRRAYGAR